MTFRVVLEPNRYSSKVPKVPAKEDAMLPEISSDLEATKTEDGMASDDVQKLVNWWHEHANLCIVAATIPSQDFETRDVVMRQLEESMSRGEQMLRAVLVDTQNLRRSVMVMRTSDPYRSFPSVSGLMPASGMNRFDENITQSARLTKPNVSVENPTKELLPSRTYIKKSS
jgi:hypothetical protein